MKCPRTSHVEGGQFLNSQHAWACWDMVARGILSEIPRLTFKCTLCLTKWIDKFVQMLMDSKFQSKPRVVDTNDVKQKTSLLSVQGKICLVLFHGFCSFVLCHLCPVQEVTSPPRFVLRRSKIITVSMSQRTGTLNIQKSLLHCFWHVEFWGLRGLNITHERVN